MKQDPAATDTTLQLRFEGIFSTEAVDAGAPIGYEILGLVRQGGMKIPPPLFFDATDVPADVLRRRCIAAIELGTRSLPGLVEYRRSRDEPAPEFVTVNAHLHDLRRHDVLRAIIVLNQEVAKHEIKLFVEIHETKLNGNEQLLRDTLQKLRGHDIGVALDDTLAGDLTFGQLHYNQELRELLAQFDIIKFDRVMAGAFGTQRPSDPEPTQQQRSMKAGVARIIGASLLRALGRHSTVVTEGVEVDGALDAMRKVFRTHEGPLLAQGWHFPRDDREVLGDQVATIAEDGSIELVQPQRPRAGTPYLDLGTVTSIGYPARANVIGSGPSATDRRGGDSVSLP